MCFIVYTALYNVYIKQGDSKTIYLIEATLDGWKVTRPSGVVMNLKTLSYALYLTDGEPGKVYDMKGCQIA